MEQIKTRRRHSAQFKAQVLSACAQPGASVASVALSYGLNANLVGQWRRGRGTKRAGDLQVMVSTDGRRCAASQNFVALALPSPPTADLPLPTAPPAADIRVELRRGELQVALTWPVTGSAECVALLRDLLR